MNRLLLILCAFVAGCLLCGPASAQCGPVRKVAVKAKVAVQSKANKALACSKGVLNVSAQAVAHGVTYSRRVVHRGVVCGRGVLNRNVRRAANLVQLDNACCDCDSYGRGCCQSNQYAQLPAKLAANQSAADEPATVGPSPVSVVERQRSRTVIRRSVLNCVNGNCQQ